MAKGEGVRREGEKERGKVVGERFDTTVFITLRISFGTQFHLHAKE